MHVIVIDATLLRCIARVTIAAVLSKTLQLQEVVSTEEERRLTSRRCCCFPCTIQVGVTMIWAYDLADWPRYADLHDIRYHRKDL